MTRLGELARGLDALLRSDSDDFRALTVAAGLDPASDFRNADLSGLDIRFEDLRAFDLRNAHFRNTLVEGTRFNGTVTDRQLDEAIRVGDGSMPGDRPRIAVISIGHRGVEVGRHLRDPDWYPTLGSQGPGPSYRTTPDDEVGVGGGHEAIFIAPVGIMPPLSRFDIVIVIADDDAAEDMSGRRAGVKYPSLSEPRICLLAPALPKDGPSSILSSDVPLPGPFHAVLDTSVARSPYWSGNPSRALDRRIADVAIAAAMLVGNLPEVAETLVRTFDQTSTPVLSFGLRFSGKAPQTRDPATAGLASEAIGLAAEGEGGPESAVVFSRVFHPVWARQRPKDADRGIVELRRLDRSIPEDFLFAVADAVAKSAGQNETLVKVGLPTEVASRLRFPSNASGVRASPDAAPVAVISETPDLGMVEAADEVGWRVARYTDDAFLFGAFSARLGGSFRQLPGELRLPSFEGWIRNGGLATRGVDPRDVIKLDPEILEDMAKAAPELRDLVRGFRAAFDVDRDVPAPNLLSTHDLSEWFMEAPDPGGTLRARLDALRIGKPSGQKRPADLRAAWAGPAGVNRRFIVADGPIPIRLDQLAPGQVPAQSLFFVDGDAGVPALLQSSVFAVWARATTTRSTSWMQRFSVGRTFETFPVAKAFAMGRSDRGGVHLQLRERDGRLASMARDWLVHVEDVGDLTPMLRATYPSEQQLVVRAELDAEILRAYDLPVDASDLQIMERLLGWLKR